MSVWDSDAEKVLLRVFTIFYALHETRATFRQKVHRGLARPKETRPLCQKEWSQDKPKLSLRILNPLGVAALKS